MYEPDIENAIPSLFSYITIRREYFGGFLFNPYLIGELNLDHSEYKVAEYCTGYNTAAEISSLIAKDLNIDKNSAWSILRTAIEKLNTSYAIN